MPDTACGCTDSVLYHIAELPHLGLLPQPPVKSVSTSTPLMRNICGSPMPINISLYDLTGRLLQQSKGTNEMNMAGFADGVYLLRIEGQQGRFLKMEKVVKRK